LRGRAPASRGELPKVDQQAGAVIVRDGDPDLLAIGLEALERGDQAVQRIR
jgi:hypothetical protein